MNTKTIFSAIVALLLSANIYASKPIVYKNETATETGKKVEFTIFKNGLDVLDKRMVSNYNDRGALTEKITYGWHESNGWMPQTKLVYTYTANNELLTVAHTKWNDVKNKWNEKSDIAQYDATNGGVGFLAEVK